MKKSAFVDMYVKKLEDKIKEDFIGKMNRVIRQDAHDHADNFED